MKIKTILFALGLVVSSAVKAAEAERRVVAPLDQVVVLPEVDLGEQTAFSAEVNQVVNEVLRARQNTAGRFGRGEDGFFSRTAHKVRSGASWVGHVLKYPAVASCAVAGPLYWYVKDEFYAPVKSFIRENFTVVVGVIAAGGLGAGLYYGPKDHKITEGYKILGDEVADYTATSQGLAEKFIIERKKNEQLAKLNGVIAQAGQTLNGLVTQVTETKTALTLVQKELGQVKDETAKAVRAQQEQRVVQFIGAIQAAVAEQGDQFEKFKAIEVDTIKTGDVSRLQVALSGRKVSQLCQETILALHQKLIQEELPDYLRGIVGEFMARIKEPLAEFSNTKERLDQLCLMLQATHREALLEDQRRMAAFVAAAQRPALPAAASFGPVVVEISGAGQPSHAAVATGTMRMLNYFGTQGSVPRPFAIIPQATARTTALEVASESLARRPSEDVVDKVD